MTDIKPVKCQQCDPPGCGLECRGGPCGTCHGTGQMISTAAIKPSSMNWRPISELTDLYTQPIMIASPKLIDGDSNPLGISDGYFQDDAGEYAGQPGKGAWCCVGFDMCNDEFQNQYLAEEDVTHFLLPNGPWTPEEAEALVEELYNAEPPA